MSRLGKVLILPLERRAWKSESLEEIFCAILWAGSVGVLMLLMLMSLLALRPKKKDDRSIRIFIFSY